ncbi:HAD family acid phosphatase [Nocardioides nematodiphilus]|jgi:ribonucleotide monophosphatase NagD (HAD superfamily)|uniref:HAD family acid phosphatase n=1 Tax=Nocardioides nematodiphilus TaxID=2849669 RepID=UPI001CDA40A6|nr:HAD family acid phosphatase [Nocardioides nematodiphilus]MCA1984223.1 HAD family acid phosphatase [Nocardioides nematodiphilus]
MAQPITQLVLSPLGHTWFLDLDGTLVKHNGHLLDGADTLLDGATELLDQIPAGDMVVLVTARTEDHREKTEAFLAEHGIRYDHLILGAPYGERIVVNDAKPSGLVTALAISTPRDTAPAVAVRIDGAL